MQLLKLNLLLEGRHDKYVLENQSELAASHLGEPGKLPVLAEEEVLKRTAFVEVYSSSRKQVSNPLPRPQWSREMRQFFLLRAGMKCACCDYPVDGIGFHADHQEALAVNGLPQAANGRSNAKKQAFVNYAQNLQVLCVPCHTNKSQCDCTQRMRFNKKLAIRLAHILPGPSCGV